MKKFFLAAVLALVLTSVVAAEHHFANITAADADKGTIVYN